MAAALFYIAPREIEHPTDLCDTCWKPSLRMRVLVRLDITGLTYLGERVVCRDESIWKTDLKEYAR